MLTVVSASLTGVIVPIIFLRFGLVAFAISGFVVSVLLSIPIRTDLSAWFAGS
jgi:hypothetical protein